MNRKLFREYVERCCISFEEAKKVRNEIYTDKRGTRKEYIADDLWERIMHRVLIYKKPSWYYDGKEKKWESIYLQRMG